MRCGKFAFSLLIKSKSKRNYSSYYDQPTYKVKIKSQEQNYTMF